MQGMAGEADSGVGVAGHGNRAERAFEEYVRPAIQFRIGDRAGLFNVRVGLKSPGDHGEDAMRLVLKLLTFALLLGLREPVFAQEPGAILLWPNGAPGSEGKSGAETLRLTPAGEHIISNIHQPSLLPFLPDVASATGTAVILLPGGGHSELWMDHEGVNVAHWLQSHGIAAFVLKYRLARQPGSTYKVEVESLADTARAIRLVRSRAAEFHLMPDRIGIAGFSAGGELVALAGTHFDAGQPSTADPVLRQSSRPSFLGLIYPAIPADMPLTADTPPAFMACGENDRPDISEGLPSLYLRFKAAKVPAELHVFTGIGHGFGVRTTMPAAAAVWPTLFTNWLVARKLLTLH
jgi:endo-1,4-beta-xylanase